jgi:hypothetical protein
MPAGWFLARRIVGNVIPPEGFSPVVACLAASKQYFERTVAEVWWQNKLGWRRAVSFGAGPAL